MKNLHKVCCGFVLAALTLGVGAAQGITGSASITVDPSSLMGTATCETDLDYDVQPYYEALVDCKVQDGWQPDTCRARHRYIRRPRICRRCRYVYRSGGRNLYRYRHHRALLYYTDEPDSGGGYTYYYDDPNNFAAFADQVNQYYPEEHYWQGPGPDVQTRQSILKLEILTILLRRRLFGPRR